MLESIRSYARYKGVSDNAVRKAIAAGKITLVNGQVDRARADAEWAAKRDARQFSKMAASTSTPAAPPAPAPLIEATAAAQTLRTCAKVPELPFDAPEEAGDTLAGQQKRLTAAKAAKAELEYDRARGEMIAVAEVEEVVGELISSAKSRLLLIEHKIRDEVAKLSDPLACGNIIGHAIREALEEISLYKVAA